jgi:hypothetical protein
VAQLQADAKAMIQGTPSMRHLKQGDAASQFAVGTGSGQPSVRLPTGELDERNAINRVGLWVATLRHKMQKEYSREWLETELRKGLREGRLSLTIKAVEAADKGDEIADDALRTVYAEMAGGMLPERGPGHLQIWAYGQRAVLRPPHNRPRGRRWYDDYARNLNICLMIYVACFEFGVRPTRNRAARRANRDPSGVSLVVAALARNGIYLGESTVQENFWLGLPGELIRGVFATRLPADFTTWAKSWRTVSKTSI